MFRQFSRPMSSDDEDDELSVGGTTPPPPEAEPPPPPPDDKMDVDSRSSTLKFSIDNILNNPEFGRNGPGAAAAASSVNGAAAAAAAAAGFLSGFYRQMILAAQQPQQFGSLPTPKTPVTSAIDLSVKNGAGSVGSAPGVCGASSDGSASPTRSVSVLFCPFFY